MPNFKDEDYVVINGQKTTIKELVKKNSHLVDMIFEGSFGDPEEVIASHMDIKTLG
jgi:hypothetical protein